MATSESKHRNSKISQKALEEAYKAQAHEAQRRQSNYTLTRASINALEDMAHRGPTAALARALYTGVKLASRPEDVFYDELAPPLMLVKELKKLGPEALIWSPETLCAVIDERFGGWTRARTTQALEHFHTTGELDTDVPDLVRQKLYALRIVITSDSAHNFWENFEKVGCVFNDRLANFSVVQALSAAECARTLAIIQNIRPDAYSREVRIYIAACCHQDGLYTTKPSKWLGSLDPELAEFNEGTMGVADPEVVAAISERYKAYQSNPPSAIDDSTESIQAAKLLGIDAFANEALKS